VGELWRAKSAFADSGDKDRVKDASDIVRVVGEVVALRPKGREYVGLCPFHDDSKPSMNVVPSKQIFHCFACGAGGDVFSFVRKFHKMEFREALEFLAERAGIALTPRGGRAEGDADAGPSRSDLIAANAVAQEFFVRTLAHPESGGEGRALVGRRGIAPEMVERFGLGVSPPGWDGLVGDVRTRRLDPRTFAEAGLFKRREDGGVYDAFRRRLMFPIQDQIGRIIGFGARRIDDADDPKYLNSPETRLFNKRATLYALNHAAKAIQAERIAIITEGYTDVIACHQAGFANTVATLGTALTKEHATVLGRMCERVVLLFDGDEAGQRAADRAVEVFFAHALDVSIATLNRFTDAKDPDELLKRDGGGEIFRAALAGATELLEYRFARVRDRLRGAGVSALGKAVEGEIDSLVGLGLRDVTPVRQRLIVKRLAQVAGIDEETVLRAIPAGRAPRRPLPASPPETLAGEGAEERVPVLAAETLTAADHLLGCVLCDGELWRTLGQDGRDFIGPRAYRWPLLSRLAQLVDELGEEGVTPDLSAVLRVAEDERLHAVAVGLASRVDAETDRDRDRLHRHWRECLKRAQRDASGPAADSGIDAAIAQIEGKRRSQASLGADRRVLPRPG